MLFPSDLNLQLYFTWKDVQQDILIWVQKDGNGFLRISSIALTNGNKYSILLSYDNSMERGEIVPRSSHGALEDGASQETRRLILQAAQRLFLEQGYRAVSTRQIAAMCGITQPALYRHFATKQDLYVAVLLETLQQTHTRLMRLVERRESMVHRLHLVARMLPIKGEDVGQMFHDIGHELDEQARQQVAAAFREQIVAPIASMFSEGIEQGLLRDAEHGGLDPFEAVFVFFRLLDDHHSLTPHAQIQHVDRMVDVLMHGLILHPEKEP